MLLLWAVDSQRQVSSLHLPVFTWHQEALILTTDVLSHLLSAIHMEYQGHLTIMISSCICYTVTRKVFERVFLCGGYMSRVISMGYWSADMQGLDTDPQHTCSVYYHMCLHVCRCICSHLCLFDNSNPQKCKAWRSEDAALKYQTCKDSKATQYWLVSFQNSTSQMLKLTQWM